jgi:hypothetical protein
MTTTALPAVSSAVTLDSGVTGTVVRHSTEEGVPVAVVMGTGHYEGELHYVTPSDLRCAP